MSTDNTKIHFTSQTCIEFILFPINYLWISYMVTSWCVYLTRAGLRIDSSSTLFFRLGSMWILSVSQLKDLARWKEILVQWRSNRCHKNVFCRPQEILLFWSDEKIWISLDWVCSHRRRLCWEIQVNFSKNKLFTYFFTKLIKQPSYGIT